MKNMTPTATVVTKLLVPVPVDARAQKTLCCYDEENIKMHTEFETVIHRAGNSKRCLKAKVYTVKHPKEDIVSDTVKPVFNDPH